MKSNNKIGLALSGGGLRAAAFHLGTIKKLYQLKILDSVNVLSTISGGAIIGAYYALNKDNFNKFESDFKRILNKNFILRILISPIFLIRIFTIALIIVSIFIFIHELYLSILLTFMLIILIGIFFYKIFPTTRLIKNVYDNLILYDKKLKDLPDNPLLIINSTNLDTGTLFSFTKDKSFDSTYNFQLNKKVEFETESFPIAKAVACSTSVPYVFAPTELKFIFENTLIKPKLVDGGIYDNQGIYRLTSQNPKYKCDIVVVSDASYPFKKKYLQSNPLPVLNRIVSVMMKRIKSIQFVQRIYENDETELFEIAYFSIDYEYERCVTGFVNAAIANKIRPHLIEIHAITDDLKKDKLRMQDYLKDKINYDSIVSGGVSQDDLAHLRKIKTGLSSLSDREIDLLTRHAMTLTEIQIRLYCPSLVEL